MSRADAQSAVYKLEPDGDMSGRSDVIVGVSRALPLHRVLLSDLCKDQRASRTGETFVYLKMDGTDGLDGSRYADRGDIEDALDAALRGAQAGCVVGGASGQRHSYVDLALTDEHAAIEVIRQRLRDDGLPRRAWLLYFDADLVAEWIPVHPGEGPPPGLH